MVFARLEDGWWDVVWDGVIDDVVDGVVDDVVDGVVDGLMGGFVDDLVDVLDRDLCLGRGFFWVVLAAMLRMVVDTSVGWL